MSKNLFDKLGDRMKNYENVERRYLTKRTPTIIRVDGRAFHSFTKGFQKPFDIILMEAMWSTAKYLCENVMGCKIAYVQSDEISLLLTDYDNINTQAWFNKNIQKMCSISASMTTIAFNKAFSLVIGKYYDEWIDHYHEYSSKENEIKKEQFNVYIKKEDTATFDSRVFNIPKEEVCNYFIWRQQDATRNAIQMVGRANFSHKQLQNKKCNQIQDLLFVEKDIDFNDFPVYQKYGVCIIKESYDKDGTQRTRWVIDKNIPIFIKDRNYIDRYI